MSEIRYSLVGDVRDCNLLALIQELEIACGVSSAHFVSSPLIQFLGLCVYPGLERGKRIPIITECMDDAPLLDCKVGKLPDGDVLTLCAELAATSRNVPVNRRNIEFYHGSKLSAFLNKTIPKQDKPKKPTARQAQMDRIVRLRRSNRR